jgi:CheY-like chemotaxis protein
VDDVESNIYVARGMLLPYGLKIDEAFSGFDAINKIRDGNVYDIIFMDNMMPKMDGIETVKRLRGMGYNRSIIALTANALIGRAEMFLQNGFDGFIAKPIDSRELNFALNEFIRNKQSPDVIEAARKAGEQKKNDHGADAAQKKTADKLAAAAAHDIENAVTVLEELLPKIKTGAPEMELFATTVHGMKSALANIGEIQLSKIALRLETASANGEIPEILNDIHQFIAALRSILDKIKPPAVSAKISGGDPDFLKTKLNDIIAMCGKLNIKEAKKVLNELKQETWTQDINDILNDVSLFILRGEYTKAISAAEKAAAVITANPSA